MKDVLIFFGGVSQEHDISVITGVFTTNAIDKTLYNAIPIYIDMNGEWFCGEPLKNIGFYKNFNAKVLKKVTLLAGENSLFEIRKNKKCIRIATPSCAINALHGRNGEDGAICGLLQMCKIPIASPNMFCSELSIDKSITKIVLAAIQVPTVPSVVVKAKDFYSDRENAMLSAVNELGYPLIVKPAKSGSSIGIGVAIDFLSLEDSFEKAFRYDEKIIVEKFLKNAIEINCAAYCGENGTVVSECERPITDNDILTFDDKYNGSKSGLKREFPANISVKKTNFIRETTKKIYETLGFFGIIRIDYLIFEGEVYLNEINSVPGSLAYYLFGEKVADFTMILTQLINKKLLEFAEEQSTLHEFRAKLLLENLKGSKK